MSKLNEKNAALCVSLGIAIKARRERLRMSQEELASEAKLDRSFISSIERGKRNPSLETVAAIAAALKIKLSHLVSKCGS